MNDPHFSDATLIDTRAAALESGLHADYIARLARQKRSRGRRIGNKWHVDPVSLKEFLQRQTDKEIRRQEELKQQRKREYELSQQHQLDTKASEAARYRRLHDSATETSEPIPLPAAQAHNVLAHAIGGLHSMTPGLASHMISPIIHPAIEFLHKFTALLVAITLVFGVYSAFDPQFRSFACSTLIEASGTLFEAGKVAFRADTRDREASSAQLAAASLSGIDAHNDICSTLR